MPTWDQLKERKIVQWALAYLAGAWVLLQVTSLVGGHFGWPPVVHRISVVIAAAGLPVTLVLAWYHGEKGRQRVSGPELLILASLLLVTGIGVHMVVPDGEDPEGLGVDLPVRHRSVAVLPLDNLSPDEEHAFFAGAMTEEITTALSQVPDLTVTSRNSASKFGGSGMTVAEFARTLGVAHVIEGSVQRSGDRARVTIQLIDARTDEHVWTETYDRTLTDLFDVQVEVARQVADRLAATFTDQDQERILAGATDDPVAYDLFLQARSGSVEEDREIELLRQAVERDPSFWPAWERLSLVYLQKERQGGGARWADSARAALDRALEAAEHPSVDLRLEANRAMVFGGDEDQALGRLRAAAEVRPSDLFLVQTLAQLYRIRGRLPEAARWRRHAARLDPLNAGHWHGLFQIYWWVQLYDRAEEALDRALELEPNKPGHWIGAVWHWTVQSEVDRALAAADSAGELGATTDASLMRGQVLWWAGRLESARAEYAAYDFSRNPNPPAHLLPPMAHTLFTVGDSARGYRVVERIRKILGSRVIQDYEPEWRVFPRLQLAALEGDTDRAVSLFLQYVERGGRDPAWFEGSPLFAELRTVPAFQVELERLRRMVDEMRRRIERDLQQSGA